MLEHASGPWTPPDVDDHLAQRVGSSIIDDFVLTHSAADVLREIVQNEFDGGGSRITIRFTDTELIITGTGKPISAAGWARLSVIVGTGAVIGGEEAEYVVAKADGIGSKNFGIRSLFFFGDRIFVRSNGQVAVLDLLKMASARAPDPSSLGQPGVSIHVPYRLEAVRLLAPFDVQREERAMSDIAQALLPTLVKLAGLKGSPGIQRFEAISERTGRHLVWAQTAKAEPSRVRGVSVLRRTGRLEDKAEAQSPPIITKVEEIEFVRSVSIPTEHAAASYPRYFKTGARTLKIAVSLPLVKKRVDLTASGRFYYPLQTPLSRTGLTLSVSAPFRLDQARTSLVMSPWNDWLIESASELTRDLLEGDWLDRFGADAYLALAERDHASPDQFQAQVTSHLSRAAAWPTQALKGKRPIFTAASEIVLPEHSELDGFMGADRCLDARLAKSAAVVQMAQSAGAKLFTLNSLVRLRCADQAGGARLATKIPEGEADFSYTNYVVDAAEETEHLKAAYALTALRTRLSNPNRKDLRETESTLAADGRLAAVETLTLVDEAIWDECPEPLSSRLHPKLAAASVFAKACIPFDYARWALRACERAQAGEITPQERAAVYRWLLSADTKLSSAVLAAVRRSPVVKNSRGDWVRPVDLALVPRKDAVGLKRVLQAPHSDFAKRSDILTRLSIRRKVVVDDLIALAALVKTADDVATFEDVLRKHASLLKVADWRTLSTTPCLLSRSGKVAAPGLLHIASSLNVSWIKDDDQIVAGSNTVLHRKLGCRETPSSDVLYAVLSDWRENNLPPVQPDQFYPALAAALRAEGKPIHQWSDEPILFYGSKYHAPATCLVSPLAARVFRVAVPMLRSTGLLGDAYEALGASGFPKASHWLALLRWFETRAAAHGGILPVVDRRDLKEVYSRRLAGGGVDDLPDGVACLLTSSGSLCSIAELKAGAFLEDDYPALADALREAKAKVAFGDTSPQSREFFHRLGVKPLSALCGEPALTVGDLKPVLGWVANAVADVPKSLSRTHLVPALWELSLSRKRVSPAFRHLSMPRLSKRISSIQKVAVVSDLWLTYRLAGKSVRVPTDFAFAGEQIVMLAPRTAMEFDQRLSLAIAEAIGAVRIEDRRALSPLITLLLRYRSREDAKSFLLSQGIQTTLLDGATDQEDLFEDRTEEIVRGLFENLDTRPTQDPPPPPPPPLPPPPPAGPVDPPPPPSLPPLDQVSPREAEPSGSLAPPQPPTSRGSGGGGFGWRPRTSYEVERDRLLGDRGEALVYALELERVRALGHSAPETVVSWTSRTDPGADHDIRSIDKAGQVLWIEVKSTSGRDGRFEWSRREFEKAMREGPRYELVRVYEAGGLQPTIKRFRNPAALQGHMLRIELSTLRAFVEETT